MLTKPLTLNQFLARFPDDNACLDHMMRVRYGERFECPKCHKQAHYYRVKKRRAYECEHCGNQVYPTAGTPFENTRTSLRSWFHVMFLFTTTRNGVAAKEVQRQLGVTYKTAWRMCWLIREYMGFVDGDDPIGGPGGGIVEADKTFIGGHDRLGEGDKTVVLGMVERGGDAITRVIPNRRAESVQPHILRKVRQGSRIATDKAYAFADLERFGFQHEAVDHSKKEWARGQWHTNTVEAFWSMVKRTIGGTHVWVSPKYLQTYLREIEFRWNLRKTPWMMFDLLLMAFPRPRARA
ncbi:MAG: IS1595 family transposase [Bauldia sp.]|nr:IS1595 family transposase [Bauldia sp.]